jgi:hypothetical protein
VFSNASTKEPAAPLELMELVGGANVDCVTVDMRALPKELE